MLYEVITQEIEALNFADLFAPESRNIALDYLEALTRNDTDSMLGDGREVIGSVRSGGQIQLQPILIEITLLF